MSYKRGWDAINLVMPETIPHTEYCSHIELVKYITGIDPRNKTQEKKTWQKFYKITDYDFLWYTYDSPEWFLTGKTTNMGHAEFQEGGTDYNANIYCPYKDVEDVLNFDPVKELGIPDINNQTRIFEEIYQTNQKENPELVFPGGYYNTIFSACILVFGWDIIYINGGQGA